MDWSSLKAHELSLSDIVEHFSSPLHSDVLLQDGRALQCNLLIEIKFLEHFHVHCSTFVYKLVTDVLVGWVLSPRVYCNCFWWLSACNDTETRWGPECLMALEQQDHQEAAHALEEGERADDHWDHQHQVWVWAFRRQMQVEWNQWHWKQFF